MAAITAALTATVPLQAHACSGNLDKTKFADVAPEARNLLVFQIESLELGPESNGTVHTLKGKIRVLRKYRDSSDDFQWIRFDNTICLGRRLDVGGIYLVATNSSPPLLELGPRDGAILQLSGTQPLDPDYILQVHPTIKRLLDALNGSGSFDIGTLNEQVGMSRETAPPPVPPPEELCAAQCKALDRLSQPTAPVPGAARRQ